MKTVTYKEIELTNKELVDELTDYLIREVKIEGFEIDPQTIETDIGGQVDGICFKTINIIKETEGI